MIEEILKKQLSFEGATNHKKFATLFTSLYRIELFKDGLDLILSKIDRGNFKFEVKLIKGWDTNVGCYLKGQNKIIIRSLEVNVLAHEMAHALEVESGIKLNEEFRKSVALDLNGREPSNIALKGEIKRLLIEGVKSYPTSQILSELFSRYFELLSLSRNVKFSGDFTTIQVMDFFTNTTKWLAEIFNPKLRAQINTAIAAYSTQLIDSKNLWLDDHRFRNQIDSFYKKADSSGKKTWGANTKSNALWQKSWENYKTIEDDKKKNS